MTSHYTWGSVTHTTWFWRCLGTTFGHFLLGYHNFMVTARGSCVKWPLLYAHIFFKILAKRMCGNREAWRRTLGNHKKSRKLDHKICTRDGGRELVSHRTCQRFISTLTIYFPHPSKLMHHVRRKKKKNSSANSSWLNMTCFGFIERPTIEFSCIH